MTRQSGTTHEFEFSLAEFDYLRELIRHHTGINIADHKKEMVYSRLSRRLRALHLSNFASYCELLRYGDGEELTHLINAITTNLTAFFREPHHFDFLRNTLLPALLARKTGQKRLRIWSAGCASGEEAYSIAMIVREVITAPGWDVKILATDLDSNVLAKATKGIYPLEQIKEQVPLVQQRQWFEPSHDEYDKPTFQVAEELRNIVFFRQLNLIDHWPMRGQMDIIFCRNVVIYFSKQTQRTLFNRFANMLTEEGYLFIGHSESLFQISERFRLLNKTIYVKISFNSEYDQQLTGLKI